MKRQNPDQELRDAVWVAHSLFERGKTAGSSANLSIRAGDTVYITASGTCFGRLREEDLVPIGMDGKPLSDRKPSKEWPLHLALYEKSPEIGAVVHTHSSYSVLWSFAVGDEDRDCIPPHTPYLRMKLGSVGAVPYERPGSEALFAAFRARVPSATVSFCGSTGRWSRGPISWRRSAIWRSWKRARALPGSFGERGCDPARF